jgi:hypothetical protein
VAGRLFKRNIRLTLARPRGAGSDGYFTQEANAVIIEELRVVGNIARHLHSEPNTCALEIYNLSDASRAAFQKKPLHVLVEAGYDGEYKRVFVGDMRYAYPRTAGPDRVLYIEVGDGERAYNHAHVGRSFKAGVSKRTVVDELAKSMGLKMPKTLDDARELLDQFATGVTLQGPSQRELTRVLKSAGMTWSVQNGTLQILRPTDVRADQAIIISEENGMIESPEMTPPKKPGESAMLSAKMLLIPEVAPGGRVRVESRDIPRGMFRVESVRHTLDTDPRGLWQTDIEAKPL